MKEIYPGDHRGRAMGYVRTEMALIAVVFTYVGGTLLDLVSYRILFPLGAALGAIALLPFRKIKEPLPAKNLMTSSPSFLQIVKLPLRDKRFLIYIFISFLAGSGSLLVLPLYPIYLVSYLNLSHCSIGQLGALFSLMWMFSYLFWGEILSQRRPCYVLSLIYSLA